MRIVFMGTPDFAVASLAALLDKGYNVCGVVTVADKPAGRGQFVHESAVKKYASEKGLFVMQPTNLKDPAFIEQLRALKADVQFVVAFRMLPEQVWNMPTLGTYNVHASLLPKYRGAAPINHAIMSGDEVTGVTTFKLQHQIDTGSVLFREQISIGAEMNAGELHDALMHLGANLIVKTAEKLNDHLINGTTLDFVIQNENEVSHAPKIFKENCLINWKQKASDIHNFIRGLSPYPAAYSNIAQGEAASKVLKIFSCKIAEAQAHAAPGKLRIEKDALYIAASDAWIKIEELQLEGKKKMKVSEFLRGVREPEAFRIC